MIIITNNVYSQKKNFEKRNFDKRNYFTYGVHTYTDVLLIPVAESDSADANVIFKILYDALTFTQVNPLENPEQFRAIATAEIIISDDQGIIRGRLSWIDTLFVKNFELTNSKDKYLEGLVNKRLAPGKYKISLDLIDKIEQKDNKNDFDIDIPNKDNSFLKPIFGELKGEGNNSIFKPFIWDNKVNFSSKNIDVLSFSENLSDNDKVYYSLKKVKSKSLNYVGDSIDITSEAKIIRNSSIKYNNALNLWEINSSVNSNTSIINFELPAEDLTPGTYNLAIFNNNSNRKSEITFDVEWIDIPYSLQDFDYSYRILQYILTDEQYDELSSGSDDEIMKKMSDFWQKKDPTIGTPFNEAVEQYYKRVDYSFFNFQSIKERDGAKTARGKIYILFGRPDDISNQFVDGKSQEIWRYNKLNKKFTFEIRDQSVFELISIEG